MKNIPKFLYANSLKENREFVIHTGKNACILEIFEPESEEEEVHVKKQVSNGATTEVNGQYYILAFMGWIGDEPSPREGETEQEFVDRMAGLFRRAADWWRAYLLSNKEDNEE